MIRLGHMGERSPFKTKEPSCYFIISFSALREERMQVGFTLKETYVHLKELSYGPKIFSLQQVFSYQSVDTSP